MTKDEIVQHWIASSDEDVRVMNSLFAAKHFAWCLFVGHLAVEKMLKGYYVAYRDINVPRVHNLLKIAEEAVCLLAMSNADFLTRQVRLTLEPATQITKIGFLKLQMPNLPHYMWRR